MAAREPAGPRARGIGVGEPGLWNRLRDLAHLPRDQALARLGYDLKRPVFSLPVYRYSLPGLAAAALRVTPSDPWPGNAEQGGAIARGVFEFAGQRLADPVPLWSPAGAGPAWLTAMHGFDWLRDLRAAGGDSSRRRARELVGAWLEQHDSWTAPAWDPLATGMRLGNWLGCYEFFAASGAIEFRHRLLASVAQQAHHLCRVLPAGLSGADLIAAVKGLVYAGVCLPGGDAWRERGLALLARALDRQVGADGGHVERSPSRHAAVLRDLIDLRALLHRHEGPAAVPAGLHTTLRAMASALAALRHGDGGLALFNGSTEEEGWQIDMILQRAGGPRRAPERAEESGFERLQAGRTVVLVDAGAPPPPGFDGHAHAGTLGLEVSVGQERLIVNCGARPGDPVWHWAQRTTAAHSTLVLDDTNSSVLLAAGGLGHAARVTWSRREDEDAESRLEAVHDGYLRPFGQIHRRRLALGADGTALRGEDSVEDRGGRRPARAFALRFHLHPDVRASLSQGGDSVLLRLSKGGGWRLRAAEAEASLEPSVYLGRRGEIRRSQQVAFTGNLTPGGTVVTWTLERIDRGRG